MRKLKNIIIILLIVILGIASGFTIKHAKESNKSAESGMMQGQQGQPPQMPSGDNQTNPAGDNQSTPPAKPDEGQSSSDSQGNSINQGGSQGNNGDTFYITNTTASINLTGNTIVNNDTAGNFLRAQKDSWGNSGSNGGNVTLKMTKQTVTGNIVIDSISTLDMEMSENSSYEGTINGENSAKSIALKLDSTSKIKLTGDSYVTSLDDADTTYSNIDFNGYKLYVNGTAIN